METVILKARGRGDSGKKSSRSLRRQGEVPCIMYGGKEPEKLSVKAALLSKALSGEHGRRVIVQLDIDDKGEKRSTVLKELQYHPIRDFLIHADFMEIDLAAPIKEKLPVITQGDSVGVKIKGGNLKIHKQQLAVEGLPDIIPSELFVEISGLDIGDSLSVRDIPLPEGIRIIDPEDTVVISVGMPKAAPAEEEAAVEGEAEAGAEAKPAEGAEQADKEKKK
ncbi:MAG: 50S ribosomal protein L25 [Nitrospinota bacterium]